MRNACAILVLLLSACAPAPPRAMTADEYCDGQVGQQFVRSATPPANAPDLLGLLPQGAPGSDRMLWYGAADGSIAVCFLDEADYCNTTSRFFRPAGAAWEADASWVEAVCPPHA